MESSGKCVSIGRNGSSRGHERVMRGEAGEDDGGQVIIGFICHG